MRPLLSLKDVWRKNAPEVLALWNGALPDFVTARNPRTPLGGVPIFCYHLVEHAGLYADLTFLRENNYRTLSASDFLGYMTDGKIIPDRSVLLTFDDGPRNFYDVAFPLLKQFNASAIAFIAPGLHRDAGVGDSQGERPMNWRELHEIHSSGLVQFQSHTFESRYVPSWPLPAPLAGCAPSLEEERRGAPLGIAEDLSRSREALEERFPGLIVNHLSFPMYLGTPAAVKIARSLEFKACYWGYIPGRALNRAGDSPFQMSRMSDEFLRRLPGTGRISVVQMLLERVRRIRVARAGRRRHKLEAKSAAG